MKIAPYLAAALLLLWQAALAADEASPMPPAPALAAKAYVLYDYTSNQLLVVQNGHARLAPAQLTKIMTAYVVLSAVKQHKFALNLQVYPSLAVLRAAPDDESRMYLDHNRAVTVDELLHGLMVGSGDDAVRELVDLVGGDEPGFAAMMNLQAQALGMLNTHFTNASGRADPQQYSSAYDLSLLAAAMLRDFPEYFALYAQHEYAYHGINVFNTNRLLWNDPYLDGIKTGYNESAGYCLAASAEREGRRLVTIVLGAPSDSLRDGESQKLLNYGFRNFEAVPLYRRNQPVASLRIWKGSSRTVDVGFPNGLTLTVPRGGMPHFKATLETPSPLYAPVKAGQSLGVLKLTLEGKPYAEFELMALEDVPLSNVFARGWDTIRLMFE